MELEHSGGPAANDLPRRISDAERDSVSSSRAMVIVVVFVAVHRGRYNPWQQHMEILEQVQQLHQLQRQHRAR